MSEYLSDSAGHDSHSVIIGKDSLLNRVILSFSSPIEPSHLTLFDLITISLILLTVHLLRKLINYVYRQFYAFFIDELSMDLTRDNAHSEPNGIYANGWVPVTETDKLETGKILRVRALDQDIVLMRDSDGKVHAMDPYCPHNGAHLGSGNVIQIRGEDCIQCPFHEWSFRAKDGVCVDVPYSRDRKSPKGSNLKKWPCVEVNNFIYIWFHNRGDEPDWQPETLEGLGSGKIAYCGRSEFTFNCDPYLVTENSADYYHFVAVHLRPTLLARIIEGFPFYNKLEQNYTNFSWNACKAPQSHRAESEVGFVIRLKSMEIIKIRLRVIYHGPYMNIVYFEPISSVLNYQIKMVTGLIPISSNKMSVVSRLYCGNNSLSKLIGRLHLRYFFANAQEDVKIWHNMTRLRRPLYLKEEKEMSNCNRWYSQFYDGADNHPTTPESDLS